MQQPTSKIYCERVFYHNQPPSCTNKRLVSVSKRFVYLYIWNSFYWIRHSALTIKVKYVVYKLTSFDRFGQTFSSNPETHKIYLVRSDKVCTDWHKIQDAPTAVRLGEPQNRQMIFANTTVKYLHILQILCFIYICFNMLPACHGISVLRQKGCLLLIGIF